MRYKDRSPIGEFEHRPGRGWDAEPGRRVGPRGEQHRPHGYRGHEGRGGRSGPGGRGPGGRGRGRAQRGDIRTAILLLLADQPMHGYQIMQAMSERTGGAWHPSPGAIYPTIAQLEDEGLVTTREEGGRRSVTLRPRDVPTWRSGARDWETRSPTSPMRPTVPTSETHCTNCTERYVRSRLAATPRSWKLRHRCLPRHAGRSI